LREELGPNTSGELDPIVEQSDATSVSSMPMGAGKEKGHVMQHRLAALRGRHSRTMLAALFPRRTGECQGADLDFRNAMSRMSEQYGFLMLSFVTDATTTTDPLITRFMDKVWALSDGGPKRYLQELLVTITCWVKSGAANTDSCTLHWSKTVLSRLKLHPVGHMGDGYPRCNRQILELLLPHLAGSKALCDISPTGSVKDKYVRQVMLVRNLLRLLLHLEGGVMNGDAAFALYVLLAPTLVAFASTVRFVAPQTRGLLCAMAARIVETEFDENMLSQSPARGDALRSVYTHQQARRGFAIALNKAVVVSLWPYDAHMGRLTDQAVESSWGGAREVLCGRTDLAGMVQAVAAAEVNAHALADLGISKARSRKEWPAGAYLGRDKPEDLPPSRGADWRHMMQALDNFALHAQMGWPISPHHAFLQFLCQIYKDMRLKREYEIEPKERPVGSDPLLGGNSAFYRFLAVKPGSRGDDSDPKRRKKQERRARKAAERAPLVIEMLAEVEMRSHQDVALTMEDAKRFADMAGTDDVTMAWAKVQHLQQHPEARRLVKVDQVALADVAAPDSGPHLPRAKPKKPLPGAFDLPVRRCLKAFDVVSM
jgi:hypothetical protein